MVDPLQQVKQEIRAVKYCLYNFGNITIPTKENESFRKLVSVYKKFKVEDDLVGMLKDLQGEKTKLLPSNTATVVKGMGTSGRVIRYIMYILFCSRVMPFTK